MTDSKFDSKLCRDIRLPLVLLVVFIHCFGNPSDVYIFEYNWLDFSFVDFYNIIRVTISKVVASVAVPLFFFTSGYYFFSGDVKIGASYYIKKFKRRISTLLIPYISWISLYILLKIGSILISKANPIESIIEFIHEKGGIFSMYWGCEEWNAHIVNIFGDYTTNTAPILVPLWFLRDLIFVVLLTPIIYYLCNKIPRIYVCTILLVDLLGLRAYFSIFPFYGFLFFSLGACLSIHKISISHYLGRLLIKQSAYIISLVSLLFTIYLYGSHSVLEGISYKFFRFFGSITFLNIWTSILKVRDIPLLSKYSSATFFIYASHTFLGISVVSTAFNHIFSIFTLEDQTIINIVHILIEIFKYLLIPPVVVFFCICLFRLFQRFAPWWLFNIFNGGR